MNEACGCEANYCKQIFSGNGRIIQRGEYGGRIACRGGVVGGASDS